MKALKLFFLLTGLGILAAPLQAQDFAPANMSNVIFNGTINSATGEVPASGMISLLFSSSGLEYSLSRDGMLTNPVPFTYTRNSGTSATFTEPAAAGAPGVSVALTFTSATAGTFVATYSNNATQRGTFTLSPIAFASVLTNVSTRTTLPANGTATTGFVVAGSGQRRVLIRAVGPGLAPLGVTNPLTNPTISVFRGGQQIGTNDDYAGGANVDATLPATFTRVGAFSLPANSRDAAIVMTLDPGPYTAQVRGSSAIETGDVLLEVYFLD